MHQAEQFAEDVIAAGETTKPGEMRAAARAAVQADRYPFDSECVVYDHSDINTVGGHGLHACRCGVVVARCVCPEHQRITRTSDNACSGCKREAASGNRFGEE